MLSGCKVELHHIFEEDGSSIWEWSVGDSPMSYTTTRWHLNAFQADIVHRNFVVGALEEAHRYMAAAHGLLSNLRLTDANFDVLHSGSGAFKLLMRLWNEFYSSQRDVLQHVDVLDYDMASRKLHRLVAIAEEVNKRAGLMNATFARYQCHTAEENPATGAAGDTGFWLPTVGVAALLLAAFCCAPRARVKPKIN